MDDQFSENTRQELSRVFRAVFIHSPESFSVEDYTVNLTALPNEDKAATSRLMLSLRTALYARCFCRPLMRSIAEPPQAISDGELVSRLSQANCGIDVWDQGWKVESVNPDRSVVLVRDGVRCIAAFGDYAMTFFEEMFPRRGCAATLRRKKESVSIQEGVYYAFGAAPPPDTIQGSSIRFYFHASRQGALPLIEALTVRFNALNLPFTLKTMIRTVDHDRSDATVLYVSKSDYLRALDRIRTIQPSLTSLLSPEVPLLTKRLWDGIGMAESPLSGESFGMHRSRLLAQAIVAAWTEGCQEVEGRLLAATRLFRMEGLSASRPHLNPGSENIYDGA